MILATFRKKLFWVCRIAFVHKRIQILLYAICNNWFPFIALCCTFMDIFNYSRKYLFKKKTNSLEELRWKTQISLVIRSPFPKCTFQILLESDYGSHFAVFHCLLLMLVPCLPWQAAVGLVRKGSLPLSDSASVSSSLRRMKRKAPSPPSRAPQDQRESTNEPGNLFMLFDWKATESIAG